MKKKKPAVTTLLFKSYLTLIKGSVGTAMFQKWYCAVDGKKTDVVRNGELSCALYVTSILKIFDLIDEPEITVHRAVRAMSHRGWRPISKPRIGSVIVWGEKQKNGEVHKHLGFYIGNGKAISNSNEKRSPNIHAWDYRPVEKILWNEKLK